MEIWLIAAFVAASAFWVALAFGILSSVRWAANTISHLRVVQRAVPSLLAVSRRNAYKSRVLRVRVAAGLGLVVGLATATEQASAPVLDGGVLLSIVAVWALIRPRSPATIPLGLAWLGLGVALLMGYVPGGSIWGGWVALSLGVDTLRAYGSLTGELAGALTEPPDDQEIEEEQFEDLVQDVATSSMRTDPRHLYFETWDLMSRSQWEARLRPEDGLFVSKPPSENSVLVLAKADVEITPGRRVLIGSARLARFHLGKLHVKGKISREALDRYGRWKGAGLS